MTQPPRGQSQDDDQSKRNATEVSPIWAAPDNNQREVTIVAEPITKPTRRLRQTQHVMLRDENNQVIVVTPFV